MKEDNHRPIKVTAWGAYASKRRLWIGFLALCMMSVSGVRAQTLPFYQGERIEYELYFKWGLIMSRAGVATLSVREATYRQEPAWHYNLLFRTAGLMEKVYRMRDTMDCHYSKEPRLLFSSKRTNEGDYYLVDDLTFQYPESKGKVQVHSHRYTLTRTKIDTLLTGEGQVFDMLGATMYLRSLDGASIRSGEEFPFTIAIGRDMVKARYRYTGQEIVEHKHVKYRTRHFFIDIYDEAFTQTKAAAEVWIGDDENHVPVKIRAKLKIGAAEVYFREAHNLRTPLTCRIALPKR